MRSGVRQLGNKAGLGHYSFLDRVPICGFLHPILALGSHASRLEMPSGAGPSGTSALDSLLDAARAAGRRRALVFAVAAPDGAGGEAPAAAHAAAAARGMEIPPDCYVPCPTAPTPGTVEALAALALRVADEEKCDSILLLQDNFAEPFDRALAARPGAAARRLFVAAWGSRPVTQRTAAPVEWHGHDLLATLDSFADWCDAVHAGATSAPPPVLATF